MTPPAQGGSGAPAPLPPKAAKSTLYETREPASGSFLSKERQQMAKYRLKQESDGTWTVSAKYAPRGQEPVCWVKHDIAGKDELRLAAMTAGAFMMACRPRTMKQSTWLQELTDGGE